VRLASVVERPSASHHHVRLAWAVECVALPTRTRGF